MKYMTDDKKRILEVNGGLVQCTSNVRETIHKCRFCVHSSHFYVKGSWTPSPARAYCTIERATSEVNLADVKKVKCDDARGEGFRSIMNVIS